MRDQINIPGNLLRYLQYVGGLEKFHKKSIDNEIQGRIHRGGHGGPCALPCPLHQNDNRQFVFGADF